MFKRIIPLVIALLVVGAPEASAQKFLEKLKQQVEKSYREATSGGKTRKPSGQQRQPAQKAPAQQQQKAPVVEYVPIPSGHAALFEPIGYATTRGQLGGKAFGPITKQSEVKAWEDSFQSIELSTNQRLVDEYLAYEEYLAVDRDYGWEGNYTRRDVARREIEARCKALSDYVTKLKYSKDPALSGNREGKDVMLSFGKLLDGEIYKRTLNSPIEPLKILLDKEVMEYFETYGGLEAAYLGERTKWYPYKEVETVGTSIEGLEGYVNLNGEIDIQGLKFSLKGNAATLKEIDAVNYTKSEVDVPGQIIRKGKSYTVTAIDDGAFAASVVKVVRLPDTIKEIRRDAFMNMPNLTNVKLPESLEKIGTGCFRDCKSLQEITITGTVSLIDFHCFNGCSSLKTVTLPSSIRIIEQMSFENCSSLTSINFPEGLTAINYHAFKGCRSLKNVELPSSLTNIDDSAFAQ